MWCTYLSLNVISMICIIQIHGHGTMVLPINWFDHPHFIVTEKGWKVDYNGIKSGRMCMSGCFLDHRDVCPESQNSCNGMLYPGCSCMWFTNYTFIDKPTLFNPTYRTYPHVEHPDRMRNNPWFAPGSAHVDDPCGVAGGNLRGCIGGPCMKNTYAYGARATDFKFHYQVKETEWTRGGIAEVAWGIVANHGGGYSYRLCKFPIEGNSGLTEECFQRIPLKFVGTRQWVQYGEDVNTRVEFRAVRVNTGTFPKGSQWTKNPIPACNGDDGGYSSNSSVCLKGTQFAPPKPGLFGFGVNHLFNVPPFNWSIVDKVNIPKDLEPGHYVLSFRWDCEQTSQVWNSCASIKLI